MPVEVFEEVVAGSGGIVNNPPGQKGHQREIKADQKELKVNQREPKASQGDNGNRPV